MLECCEPSDLVRGGRDGDSWQLTLTLPARTTSLRVVTFNGRPVDCRFDATAVGGSNPGAECAGRTVKQGPRVVAWAATIGCAGTEGLQSAREAGSAGRGWVSAS
jgi:hypothetical protein